MRIGGRSAGAPINRRLRKFLQTLLARVGDNARISAEFRKSFADALCRW
jgi:hypothetical protein